MLKPPVLDGEIKLYDESSFIVPEVDKSKEEKEDLSEMLRNEYNITESLVSRDYISHLVSQQQKSTQNSETKNLIKILNKITEENSKKEVQLRNLSGLVSELSKKKEEELSADYYLEKIEKIKTNIIRTDEECEEEEFETERLKAKLVIKTKEMTDNKKLSLEAAEALKRLIVKFDDIKNTRFVAQLDFASAKGEVLQCKKDGENMKVSYQRAYDLMLRKKEKIEQNYQNLIEQISFNRMKNRVKYEEKANLLQKLENGEKERKDLKKVTKINQKNLKTYGEKFRAIKEILSKEGFQFESINEISEDDALKIIEGFADLKSRELSLSTMFTEMASQHIINETLRQELKSELYLLKQEVAKKELLNNPLSYEEMRESLNCPSVDAGCKDASNADNMIMKIYHHVIEDLSKVLKVMGLITKYGPDISINVKEIYEHISIELPSLKKGPVKRAVIQHQKTQSPSNKPSSRVSSRQSHRSLVSTPNSRRSQKSSTSSHSRNSLKTSNSRRATKSNTALPKEEEKIENFDQFAAYLPLTNFEIEEVYFKFFPSQKENCKKFIAFVNSIPIIRHVLSEESLVNYLQKLKYERGNEDPEKDIFILLEEMHDIFKKQAFSLFSIFKKFFTVIERSTDMLVREVTYFYKQNYPKKINSFYEDLKINLPGGMYKEPRFSRQTQGQMKLKFVNPEENDRTPKFKVIEREYVVPQPNKHEDSADPKKNPEIKAKGNIRSLSGGLPLSPCSIQREEIFKEVRNIDKKLANLKLHHQRSPTNLLKPTSPIGSDQLFMKKISRISRKSKQSAPQTPQASQSPQTRDSKHSQFKSARSSPINSSATTAFTVNVSSIII
ncbi:unnamed protein product [Blepharisma stoltei]|uniref:Uncharacterized protein n=1 Tax=Blepharisma stoltei TaxID=1481888 RepID=A0AAU9IMB6_9CILI|nr:unnamed protein product [Blepharisma stoltei]